MIGIHTEPERSLLSVHVNKKKLGAYITHNAFQQLTDNPGGNLTDYMQLPLEPRKALCISIFFFFFRLAVVLPKTHSHVEYLITLQALRQAAVH